MTYNFDTPVDRSNTNALAVEGYRDYLFNGQDDLKLQHSEEELISMWVADMAFATAPAATEAMIERIAHPIFGYTMNFGDEYYNVFCDWSERHYGWRFEREDLFISLGVIPALFDLVAQICTADEHALTFTPAYGYFKHATSQHNRTLVTCALKMVDGDCFIDFDDLRAKAADPNARLLFLCHPHNPTGRSWTDDELRELANICFENNVFIISDEIHCDLLRHGRTHTPLAKLFPESDQIITCMAPSKTFNLAGMMTANIIIPNAELREIWQNRPLGAVNPIGMAAAQGVYKNGDAWLDALRTYLDDNFAELKMTLQKELPQAIFKIPDATYLGWVDLSAYFPPSTNLTRFFLEEAGVIVEGGEMFVADGGTCIRVNVACPKARLQEGLQRMIQAIRNRN